MICRSFHEPPEVPRLGQFRRDPAGGQYYDGSPGWNPIRKSSYASTKDHREVGPLADEADHGRMLADSSLDQPYAKAIEPVHRSGRHKPVARGLNLMSLV